MPALNPREYYRLPWSFTDNAISWLEVTTSCNLACEGCYRPNEKNGHKTLAQIAEELAVLKKLRKSDCISIAGGDPLVHPEIVEIVRMIKDGGWKPILNTNGLKLTPELLKDLKKAGVYGFTFHIDTTQKRSDSKASVEADHNALRLKFAQMLANEGGIGCSFNQTVSVKTLDQVPDVIRWAKQYPDIVHTMVFILFRSPDLNDEALDFYAYGKKMEIENMYKESPWGGDRLIKANEVVAKIKEADPLYEPNSYLGGTADPMSTKWLLASRVARGSTTFGYTSPRLMEISQHINHLFKGTWLSYADPKTTSLGRIASFLLAPFDKKMRAVARRIFIHTIKTPLSLFKPAYVQTFAIIQPVDFMADGSLNMCDSCPDITVHNGKLYWSCRLEEIKKYGCFLTAVPRKQTLHVVADKTKKAANQ
ncbi:MAG: radical SAM protein [Deltaproteobacteria bacterium]|nr:radical SAM protein [Deltaproteobacteria bacterium]